MAGHGVNIVIVTCLLISLATVSHQKIDEKYPEQINARKGELNYSCNIRSIQARGVAVA